MKILETLFESIPQIILIAINESGKEKGWDYISMISFTISLINVLFVIAVIIGHNYMKMNFKYL